MEERSDASGDSWVGKWNDLAFPEEAEARALQEAEQARLTEAQRVAEAQRQAEEPASEESDPGGWAATYVPKPKAKAVYSLDATVDQQASESAD